MIDVTCRICGKIFLAKPGEIDKRKYCGVECARIGISQTSKGRKLGRPRKCEVECNCNRHNPEIIKKSTEKRRANGTYDHPVGCTCKNHSEETSLKKSMARRGKRSNTVPAIGYYLSKGYIVLTGQHDHPLADPKTGHLTKHRKTLYEEIGPGDHPCHWCGKLVNWNTEDYNLKLHVDHLDDDKLNNNVENLVPSCFVCNIHRGRK